MSVAGSQAQTFLRLLQQLRPRWRTDHALPRTIQSLLAGERSFGSRDRRLYRELIYTTLRHLPWIEPLLDAQPDEAVRRVAWLAAELPATKAFRAAFATGEPPSGDNAELLPAWFRAHCPEIFSGVELETQLRRAPLWLRLQTDDVEAVEAEFAARGWPWRRSTLLPDALEIPGDGDVTKTEAFQSGQIEVQDLGSQLILESIGIEAGGRWLDACAGAGGKTLQLARLLGRAGVVTAHDVRQEALDELANRARRAGCHLLNDKVPSPTSERPDRRCHLMDDNASAAIRIRPGAPDGKFDGVLVDAPCSGSGTWRRAPHLKWTTTPALVAERAALQAKLLTQFAACVQPGGRLVYATCSLSGAENEAIVAGFLAAHLEFRPAAFANTYGFELRGNGLTLMPSRHDTDGFFVASFRRRGVA